MFIALFFSCIMRERESIGVSGRGGSFEVDIHVARCIGVASCFSFSAFVSLFLVEPPLLLWEDSTVCYTVAAKTSSST